MKKSFINESLRLRFRVTCMCRADSMHYIAIDES